MNWLVTGGAGFIGSNLIDHLMKTTEHRITIIDDFSAENRDVLDEQKKNISSGRITIIEQDMRDPATLKKGLEGQDVVVHLAAQTGVLPSNDHPMHSFENNCYATFSLLQQCTFSKPKAVILASSGAVVGASDQAFSIHDRPKPCSIYGATKASTEMFASAFSHAFNLNIMALRFGNVYGPRSFEKQSVIPKFIKGALEGKAFSIYGDGLQTRDYIYVQDLVNAICAASERGKGGTIYHIAGGQETNVQEISTQLLSILQERNISLPAAAHTPENPLEVKRSVYDITHSSEQLQWQPSMAIAQGLSETVDWFMNYRK
jgi:UDP-glucose 4-epimerase